ncbi:MAG: hypothetical protein ACEPOV_05590 [Hyphomicrobiales bacterium]
MYKSIFLFLIFFCIVQNSFSQFFTSGDDPYSINWQEISIDKGKIVYPKGFEEIAFKLGATFDALGNKELISMISKPRKTSVLIHTKSSVSNAFAALAPRRMEFFPVPSQDNYGEEWFRQLAIHEYRHIVQLSKMNQGFTRFLSYLFGQQAKVATFGVFAPRWFVEGDAVVTETALSPIGRGRQASFFTPLKAQVVDKGIYSYSKALFGSYKDFVPDQYVLGYNLVAYGRLNYGRDMWNQPLNEVARNSWKLSPFSIGIRKATGLKTEAFYRKALSFYQDKWKDEIADNIDSVEYFISDKSSQYQSYRYLTAIDSTTVICLESGLKRLPRIVSISKDSKKIISTVASGDVNNISYSNGLLCWDESRPHIRWSNKGYNIIKVKSLKTGKTNIYGKKNRWFAPNFNNQGNQIVAVEVGDNNKYALVILDSNSGEVIKKLSDSDNSFFQYPTFSSDDRYVVAVSFSDIGKYIVRFNIETGERKVLFDAGIYDINKPFVHNDKIFFTGSFTTKDEVYCLDTSKDTVLKVTNSRFGAYDPIINDNKFYYVDYSSDGYKIVQKDLNSVNYNSYQKKDFIVADQLHKQEQFILPDSIPEKKYETRNYSRLKHLFNFHSWSPLYFSAVNEDVGIGVSAFSQNLLGTSSMELGYNYKTDGDYGKYIINYTYSGFFPVIKLYADYGNKDGFARINRRYYEINYDELNVGINLSVPLNFSSGIWYRSFVPSINYEYKGNKNAKILSYRLSDIDLNSYSASLSFNNLYKKANSDINYKWGQQLFATYGFTPDPRRPSHIYGGGLRLYFPGIMNNHSFSTYFAYQNKKYGRIDYSNFIFIPRGIDELVGEDIFVSRNDYTLPLLYPDLSIGKLYYLKRLYAKVFYDVANTKLNQQEQWRSTVGCQLITEANYFRFFAPIELGVQSAYDIQNKEISFNMIFRVNLYAY